MSYTPLHDRRPHNPYPSSNSQDNLYWSPSYGPPDTDPSLPYSVIDGNHPISGMSEEDYDPDFSEGEEEGPGGLAGAGYGTTGRHGAVAAYEGNGTSSAGRDAGSSRASIDVARRSPSIRPQMHSESSASRPTASSYNPRKRDREDQSTSGLARFQGEEDEEDPSNKHRRTALPGHVSNPGAEFPHQASSVSEASPARPATSSFSPRPQPTAESSRTATNGHVMAQQPARNIPKRDPSIILPSFFNIPARDPLIRSIGEFIMKHGAGRENLEIEIKLGEIIAPNNMRASFPALTELVLPENYMIKAFRSTMTQAQHQQLNGLLNNALRDSDPAVWFNAPGRNGMVNQPARIRYERQRQSDHFYNHAGPQRQGKIRLSIDKQGRQLACIRKTNLANLNIANPGEPFDFRVSLNVEEPADIGPGMELQYTREKDRLCYRHQLVQVDLTGVTQKDTMTDSTYLTYELEIEVLDVPLLMKEGAKEMQGLPSAFDEIIGSMVNTVRILYRNANPA